MGLKMSLRRKATVMALILVVTVTFSAASAFTTATLDRDAVINVNTDSNSMISLGAGNTDAVYENSNGHLSITMDSSTNGILGVNPAALFTFGDPASLNTSKAESSYVYAFNITVDDAVTGDGTMTLSYDYSDSNGDDNVKYKVYEAAVGGPDQPKATATDETDGSFKPTKGVTYYVVIEIDTGGGTAADLTSNDSLGGTLTISIQ